MSDPSLPSDSTPDQTGGCSAEQPVPSIGTGSQPGDESSEESMRTVSSAELLCGQRELLITHEGEVYRLRVTRNSRLILQK